MTKKIRRNLKVITEELQAALKREATDVIAIGDLLIEAQKQIKHGRWLPWLADCFGSSVSTAENYMNAARLAAKFPTVGNLKLRPTALYALGKDLASPCGLYDRKVINAIFSEAESKWVNANRAHAIALALQKPKPSETTEEERKAKAAAETAAQAEIDDIIDGPSPELPPAPEPAVQDVILPSFDQAIKALASLQTKRLEIFSSTEHGAHDIRAIADFLHAVARAIEQKQTSKHTGEPSD
jgi:hypothetical protein